MNKLYSINKTLWNEFLKTLLSDYDLYGPKNVNGDWTYQLLTEDNIGQIEYEKYGYRPIQPIKLFFLPVKENVNNTLSLHETRKRIIIGPKSCDLAALSILDKVFLSEDFTDPFYKERRENTILISTDCSESKEGCFCTEVENEPFPKENFDLNLTLINNNEFLVEIGSPKGQSLIEKNKTFFSEPKKELVQVREQKRNEMRIKVKEQNKFFKLRESYENVVKEKYGSNLWKELSKACVECGACTNICPTCHCFLLSEFSTLNSQPSTTKFSKFRYWDSCQYNGFSRMAAGTDPQDELWKRFRNRYFCKYSYKPENFGLLACTGCGRCIEACQGKIDKREVLNKAAGNK